MDISKYGVLPVLLLLTISMLGCSENHDAENQKQDPSFKKDDSILSATVQNPQPTASREVEHNSSIGKMKEATFYGCKRKLFFKYFNCSRFEINHNDPRL